MHIDSLKRARHLINNHRFFMGNEIKNDEIEQQPKVILNSINQ